MKIDVLSKNSKKKPLHYRKDHRDNDRHQISFE